MPLWCLALSGLAVLIRICLAAVDPLFYRSGGEPKTNGTATDEGAQRIEWSRNYKCVVRHTLVKIACDDQVTQQNIATPQPKPCQTTRT